MIELLLRGIYFWVLGFWIGTVWIFFAKLACLSIIGLPLGIWMVNKAPLIMTLKDEGQWRKIEVRGKAAWVLEEMPQPSWLIRIPYMFLVGWWLSVIWYGVAAALAASLIGFPIAFWMINRLPFVLTLHRG